MMMMMMMMMVLGMRMELAEGILLSSFNSLISSCSWWSCWCWWLMLMLMLSVLLFYSLDSLLLLFVCVCVVVVVVVQLAECLWMFQWINMLNDYHHQWNEVIERMNQRIKSWKKKKGKKWKKNHEKIKEKEFVVQQ